MKKKGKSLNGIFLLMAFIVFILVFTYLSLNLKNIDYGYDLQELREKEKALLEEVAILQARRATLLNLERVEDIVMNRLKYQYPEPHQFIKVFE
ncbi:MAG: hypothetical protein KAW12_28885 [Candidatus Aminicenantes bacterium]|nr:hypothetical protein [Candidatus Aminicenantes bacterium]